MKEYSDFQNIFKAFNFSKEIKPEVNLIEFEKQKKIELENRKKKIQINKNRINLTPGFFKFQSNKLIDIPEESTLIIGKSRIGKTTLLKGWSEDLLVEHETRFVWFKEIQLVINFDKKHINETFNVIRNQKYLFLDEFFNFYNWNFDLFSTKEKIPYYFDFWDKINNLSLSGKLKIFATANKAPSEVFREIDRERTLISRIEESFKRIVEL